MSNHESDRDAARPIAPIDDPLRDVIREAGHRPTMPEPAFDAIRDAARGAWSARLARNEALRARQARQRRLWTLAAGLIFAVVGIVWVLGFKWMNDVTSRSSLMVELAQAASGLIGDGDAIDGESPTLQVGDRLPPGARVETGPQGRLALRNGRGVSVRLASGSRLVLQAPGVLTLEAGAVYIDTESDAHGGGASLAIETRFGTVRDIGTQFTVTLGDDHVAIAVREGAVEVSHVDQRHRADTGAGLRLGQDGTVARHTVARHGAAWSWALAAAPPFDLEGRTLHQFLTWVARETGWTLRYQDPALAREARSIDVHGSIDDVTPDEAVPLVVPTAGLEAGIENGVMTITRP